MEIERVGEVQATACLLSFPFWSVSNKMASRTDLELLVGFVLNVACILTIVSTVVFLTFKIRIQLTISSKINIKGHDISLNASIFSLWIRVIFGGTTQKLLAPSIIYSRRLIKI